MNYRYVRNEPVARNEPLQRPDPGEGSGRKMTAARTEILQLFWQGWRQYFRPYPEAEAPTFAALQAEFQDEIAELRRRAGPPRRCPSSRGSACVKLLCE